MIATSQFTISVINDGAPGSTGPQGVSVTKVVEEYRLSNSSTELTGSGTGYTWSETKPDIPSGKYLWIRERTDLSNNTSSYGTAHCDIVISGLVQDVDRNSNAITSKVWESDITTKINEYDGSTGKSIRDRVTQTETDISGINTTISDIQTNVANKADGSTVQTLTTRVNTISDTVDGHTQTISSNTSRIDDAEDEIESTKTVANQTADKFTWLVQSGTSASNFTLTSRVAELISPQVVIKDPAGSATIITGGKIQANSITTNMLKSDAIKSTNYTASSNASSPYSATGAFLDLNTGSLYMPNFGVNGTTGAAYFNGTVNANAGKFGDDTSYWNIETVYDYNMQPHAALVGTGSPYLQTGNWQVSDNAVATRKYTSTSESAGNATYYKDSDSNTFYDVGMKIPTNFGGYSASDSSVTRYNKAFYYGRKYTGNNIPSLDSDWTYFFEIDSGGNVIIAGDVYEGGVKLSEKYAAITDVGSAYLPKTGGTITGNLTVNGSFTTNLLIQTNLASTSASQLTGNANATVTHGVTGTLGVGNGGTGKSSWTANGIVYASASNALGQIGVGTSGQVLTSKGNAAPAWTNQSALSVGSATKATQDGDGNVITDTYRALDDDQFDTIDITDAQIGNLMVTGAGRFTNGLYGDLIGNADTATTADKVGSNLVILLNSGTNEGTNKFTYNGSATKNVNITKSGIGLGNVENTALSTWAGSANLTTTKVGTLAAAATKGVDTSISASSTSANLPTSAAVASFVEGKGYVTSSGVTSVRVQATSPIVSSVNTAQSSTLNTTISLADGYGDTKNPYGTKTKNYILAGPTTGNAAAPTFRALVADDIPTLTPAKAGLGNVTNDKQVKGLSSGTTSGHLVSWGADGYTVADSGIANGSVTTKITLAGSDYSASSNTITITQANLQSAVQSTGLVLMTSAERSKLSSIQVSEGGTIDFSGVTASAPLTATVGANKTVNITHNTSGVSAGTYRSVTVNTYGHVTAGTNPTTLSGYGITDAKIASGVITLGSNTITPLTASSTLDATKLSGTASVSTTGNAGTATKFNSSRTITLTGDVIGSGSGDGSSGWSIAATVKDNSHDHVPSNITPQNDYSSGTLDIITGAYIGSAASNKSFGLPAEAITIEYSTDGGSTWVTYPASDNAKRDLFNETRTSTFYLGNSATKSVNNQLRVTIEPTDRYTSFHGLYCWFTTSGNTCVCDLERSTIGAKDTFSTVFTNRPISGWSGNNINYFNSGTFGGGSTQTGNTYKYRITFKQTVLSTANNSNAGVYDIRFLGYNVWNSPNNMVSKNHMYSWDRDLNVTFPAKISATSFLGNATSATKATQDSDGNAINTTYLKRSGGTMTGQLKTNGTDIVLGATGTGNSPNDSGDLVWQYGNGTEKMRIWSSDSYTVKHGPLFRQYDENGNSLYSNCLPLADGTDAFGTWGISITGSAASATKATQDSDGKAINTTYAKLSGATFTGAVTGTSFISTSKMTLNGGKVVEISTAPRGGLFADGVAISNPATRNDQGWIRVLGTGESDTVFEIATGDDASEQIKARQYNTSNIITHEISLLDASGNTAISGKLTIGSSTSAASNTCQLVMNTSTSSLDFVFN